MTKIPEFLNFNKTCPICGNSLTLYAQFMGSSCFKAQVDQDGIIYFHPFMLKSNLSDTDYFSYHTGEDHIQFSQSHVFSKIRKDQLYFFYLCNEKGFKLVSGGTDYELGIYYGCYYRDTPLLSMKKLVDDSTQKIIKWDLDVSKIDADIINAREVFSVSYKDDEKEKIFNLSISYIQKSTTLWYYTVNDDQRKEKLYKPSIFEKRFSNMILRPDFSVENRDKLFTKLNSLVIFS
jgi:hypothetical protein